MIKLEQILSQRGEGSSNSGTTSNRGKNAMEDPMRVPNSTGSRLESRIVITCKFILYL